LKNDGGAKYWRSFPEPIGAFQELASLEKLPRNPHFQNIVYAAFPMRQQSLFSSPTLFHGGELSARKRKTRRPLCSKRPLHCVLKAKGNNLYAHNSWIESKVRNLAKRFHVKVYGVAVSFDHVHFVVKFSRRENYIGFIRALTGLLARTLGAGIWKLLPFTRVLAWGKDFRQALAYLKKNRDEAAGVRTYEERKNWYARYQRSG
jgi:hypothetical protein